MIFPARKLHIFIRDLYHGELLVITTTGPLVSSFHGICRIQNEDENRGFPLAVAIKNMPWDSDFYYWLWDTFPINMMGSHTSLQNFAAWHPTWVGDQTCEFKWFIRIPILDHNLHQDSPVEPRYHAKLGSTGRNRAPDPCKSHSTWDKGQKEISLSLGKKNGRRTQKSRCFCNKKQPEIRWTSSGPNWQNSMVHGFPDDRPRAWQLWPR